MRPTIQLSSRAKERLGHVTVATVLVAALILTGCGEDPDVEMTVASAAPEPTTVVTPVRPEPTPEPVNVQPEVSAVVAPVSYEEGATRFREGDFQGAVSVFTSYTTEKPSNVWGHYMLGLSAWKLGDYVAAESALREALSLDSTHVKSGLNLARVLLESVRPQEALEITTRLAELDDTSADVHRLKARALFQLGQVDEAVVEYRTAIALDSEDVWSMNNLGHILIAEEQFAEAAGPLARATLLRPGVATFQNNLGVVLERLGHNTKSAEAFRAALAADDTYTKASVNLARVEVLSDRPTIDPIDLTVLAEEFDRDIRLWHETVVASRDGEEELPMDELEIEHILPPDPPVVVPDSTGNLSILKIAPGTQF